MSGAGNRKDILLITITVTTGPGHIWAGDRVGGGGADYIIPIITEGIMVITMAGIMEFVVAGAEVFMVAVATGAAVVVVFMEDSGLHRGRLGR